MPSKRNTTSPVPPDDYQGSAVWGYVSLFICGLSFGSASLPIKKFEAGDGVVFQLASALAMWSIGLVVNCIRSFPRFFFLPMVGGFFFATANAKMVPILKTIGIGMGTSIRASIGIVVGWANARFGIFGSNAERPANLIENYLGVVFSVIGALFFLFVKSGNASQTLGATTEVDPLIPNNFSRSGYQAIGDEDEHEDIGKRFLQSMSPLKKRLLGVGLSITSGICVGVTYAPYMYVIDRYDDVSKNGLDYVFSMFTGVLISAFVFFVSYSAVKRNHPYVNQESIIPGCVNGWVWGVGVTCFQFSNNILGQAVTFPIACGLQSLVGVLYGIFLFKEICGRRNFIILAFGFAATLIGSALCGVSKY